MKVVKRNVVIIIFLGCIVLISSRTLCEELVFEEDSIISNSSRGLLLLDKVHLRGLEDLSAWFITKGIGEYYRRKAAGINSFNNDAPSWLEKYADSVWISEYVKSKGYKVRTVSIIDKNQYIALFRPLWKDLITETECMFRVEHDNAIYEYWVYKAWKRTSGFINLGFIVTRSDSLGDDREIIHKSKQFFKEYRVSESFVFKFPIEDLRVLYHLKAWLYPFHFRNFNLKDYVIVAEGKGKYRRKLLSEKGRKEIQRGMPQEN